MKATFHGDQSKAEERINPVHQENTHYYAMNDYTLIRVFPSEKGFADIVFLPCRHMDKPVIVVELKWDKDIERRLCI